MQIENSQITLQEALGSYPTFTHFQKHYEKQGFLTRFFDVAETIP